MDVFKAQAIALILMDMNMPVMDGYEAVRKIRNLNGGSEIPIIALTAHHGASEKNKCLQAGCTAYLSKPPKKSETLELIFECLGQTEVSEVA